MQTQMEQGWILEKDRQPTRNDGPMANVNKVQVEVQLSSGEVGRRNYFVATEPRCFDDYDLVPIKAWRPLPVTEMVQFRKFLGPTLGWKTTYQEPWHRD